MDGRHWGNRVRPHIDRTGGFNFHRLFLGGRSSLEPWFLLAELVETITMLISWVFQSIWWMRLAIFASIHTLKYQWKKHWNTLKEIYGTSNLTRPTFTERLNMITTSNAGHLANLPVPIGCLALNFCVGQKLGGWICSPQVPDPPLLPLKIGCFGGWLNRKKTEQRSVHPKVFPLGMCFQWWHIRVWKQIIWVAVFSHATAKARRERHQRCGTEGLYTDGLIKVTHSHKCWCHLDLFKVICYFPTI